MRRAAVRAARALALLLAGGAGPAGAHHGWSGCDASRVLTRAMLAPAGAAAVVGYPSLTDPAELRAERITIDGRTIELR